MFESFQKYLLDKVKISDEDLEKIESVCIHKRLHRRQFLLQEGDVSRHNTFVAKGILRQYRIDEEGEEHIMRFAVEDWWISDRESYTTGLVAKSNIDALEDSEVLQWTKENFEQLVATIPVFDDFIKSLLAKSLIAYQNRVYSAISSSAEERYKEFLRSFPDLSNRIPLHMIASYLGISRKTLNRIRQV